MKLRSQHTRPRLARGPVSTVGPAVNHEQAPAFVKDARSQLYTLLVTAFHGEDAFYETAGERHARLVALVHQCAVKDPTWTFKLINWARGPGNIRTGPLVAAVEYARAKPEGTVTEVVLGDRTQDRTMNTGRALINAVCQRADEPAEILAYWLGTYGRPVQSSVKRGLADACRRLYSPRNAVKWDSARASLRMGDVIELCHPVPRDAAQAALFARLIEERHGRDRLTPVDDLDDYKHWIAAGAPLDTMPRVATWENVAGQHTMDAAAWEAIIPEMGYMALLRNLRNFEQAGVSERWLNHVSGVLVDGEQVRRSRQLPYRFWSAWKHSGTMRFGPALEVALELSTQNITPLGGRSLVMVDVSGSMTSPMSGKSKMSRAEAAGLFGAALYVRDSGVDLYLYDSRLVRVDAPRTSVLRTMQQMKFTGGATHTWELTQKAWQEGFSLHPGAAGKLPYQRIIIITDEQAYASNCWGRGHDSSWVPVQVPVYSWDLAGYRTVSFDLGAGRHQFAGLSDASFTLVHQLEAAAAGRWPWEFVTGADGLVAAGANARAMLDPELD